MWACPHCGAPQTETARCWVCRRSSTTCSTCRHFRTSLAADVGYCGKDRWRTPLSGLELRSCWEEGRRVAVEEGAGPGQLPRQDTDGPEGDAEPDVARRDAPAHRTWVAVRGDGGPLDRPNPMRLRGFVPIEDVGPSKAPAATPDGARAASRVSRPKRPAVALPVIRSTNGALPADDWEARVSLFGEGDL